jgi:hypothetical protein
LAFASQTATAQLDTSSRADNHAPISVMGDHYHEKGEVMASYRYMSMSMKGSADGSNDLSPDTIATTVPNRFFGMPMQPPTLRVVPTEMTMDMHMLGVMYAPSDRVTLMGMLNHVSKEMQHTTYMGATGAQVLGSFATKASGIGDTSVSALIRLHEDSYSRMHLSAGLSLPTGETDMTDDVLTPMGARPVLRLPYGMQLGSGTYDLLTGLTYSHFAERSSWGAQWRSILRTGDNNQGYTFGDEHRVTSWYSRLIGERLNWSARLEWFDRDNVSGIDALIVAPVQTADPLNQGASRIDAGLGVNYRAGGHRAAFEFAVPLDQDLDGPQLKLDWQFTAGYQYTF